MLTGACEGWTVLHIDGAGIGREAARLILARCQGQPVDQHIIDVGFRIVERESTGPAPAIG